MVKHRGRETSQNVEDVRSPFGSLSVDPGYWEEDRNSDFLSQSLLAPYLTAPPQQFNNTQTLTLEELLRLLALDQAKVPATGLTRNVGILQPNI